MALNSLVGILFVRFCAGTSEGILRVFHILLIELGLRLRNAVRPVDVELHAC